MSNSQTTSAGLVSSIQQPPPPPIPLFTSNLPAICLTTEINLSSDLSILLPPPYELIWKKVYHTFITSREDLFPNLQTRMTKTTKEVISKFSMVFNIFKHEEFNRAFFSLLCSCAKKTYMDSVGEVVAVDSVEEAAVRTTHYQSACALQEKMINWLNVGLDQLFLQRQSVAAPTLPKPTCSLGSVLPYFSSTLDQYTWLYLFDLGSGNTTTQVDRELKICLDSMYLFGAPIQGDYHFPCKTIAHTLGVILTTTVNTEMTIITFIPKYLTINAPSTSSGVEVLNE